MSRDPQVDELLAPLREGASEQAGRPEIDRERVLERMSAVAEREPLERSRRRRRIAVLAVAAGLAATVGAARLRTATTSVVTAHRPLVVTAIGGEVTVHGPRAMDILAGESATIAPEGDLTTAPHAEARIKAESGVELDVLESTHVALAELEASSSAVRLFAGTLRCHVPPLAPKQTFSVVTSDLRVVVHGTVFSVQVPLDGATSGTTVRVDEGTVVVQHASGEVSLTAPAAWTNRSTESPPTTPETAQPFVKGANETPPKEPTATGGRLRRGSEPPLPAPGTLDQETRLLRSGLARERNGDLAGAAASFELLLSRYPRSPLEPDARAALARVRTRQGQLP